MVHDDSDAIAITPGRDRWIEMAHSNTTVDQWLLIMIT